MGYSTTVYLGTIDGKPKRKFIRANTKEELCKKVELVKEKNKQEKILTELSKKEKTRKQDQRNRSGSGYVYLLECDGKYKIGFSRNIKQRLKALNCGLHEVKLIFKSPFYSDAAGMERRLHKLFEKQKVRAEWFDLTLRQVNQIKQILNCKDCLLFNFEDRIVINLNTKERMILL